MKDIEKQIVNKIDEMKDEIIQFHQRLVQFPSETPPGRYKEISEFVEGTMNEMGLDTQNKRKNIVGRLGTEESPSLILYGHLDTVEAFKDWTRDPFGGEIVENRIYGRGSADDKSAVTASLFAAKALMEVGADLKGKLILTAVVDEELGGLQGADYLLRKGIVKADACLLGDGPSTYPLGYCGGVVFIIVSIKGKQTHMMLPDLPPPHRNKYSGVNAIQKMLKFSNFLSDLQEEFNRTETKYPLLPGTPYKVSYVSIGVLKGGTKISIVPHKCTLQCGLVTIPEQDVGSIKRRILEHVENLKREDPDLDITVQFPISYEPQIIDHDSKFVRTLRESLKTVLNEERDLKTCLIPTDAHYFQERGIETILYGAIHPENRVHEPDEFVYIDDLLNATKVFALTALNFLK